MRTDPDEKLVEIGVVGRAHGIAGELHVFLHNPDSVILETLDSVLLRLVSGGLKSVVIESLRMSPKSRILRFKGVTNRTEAEQLKGAKVLVPRSMLPALDANSSDEEFYVADLIGAEAWEGGVQIGVVTASRPQGDVELITVTGNQTEVEVPLVEDFVDSLDLGAGKIHLTDTSLLPTYPVRSRKK